MKGLVVISDACDIAFYSVDREFEKYVVDRIKGLEEAAGAQVNFTPVHRYRDATPPPVPVTWSMSIDIIHTGLMH